MKKMTIDGNTAAAHVAYAYSEVAAIYPITPSSTMAEYADELSAEGTKNIFGEVVRISEMQSEGGAAGAVHGSLAGGALTTTFTASQGLLLMIPNMYKIAGELLPGVFHVSARALATSALSIFGDHSDVMACRQTGFALLSSNSVQEAMDLAAVAHLAALETHVPFLHFFDGFRTSHEVNKIDVIEYDELAKLINMEAVNAFRAAALNPDHPHQRGTAQNPDIYFQAREAVNKTYEAAPAIIQSVMDKVSALTGRSYHLFDYYGAPDAENVIIIMGSGAETVEETVDALMARQGKNSKVGMLKVRLYRPFATEAFIAALPKTVKRIAVLDRTKEPGSAGEPLYQDVCNALFEKGITNVKVVGGRYGLGSKEFNPSMVYAVYKNLAAKTPKNRFTVGITDDVSGTSLDYSEFFDASPSGTIRCKFYGLGSDGTVGANKNSIKIIGDHTQKYAQGYFVYDSKKSGGITVSHLRFGDKPIKSTYLIDQADFVACHNPSYITRYDMTGDIRDGGTFLLNCSWTAKEIDEALPAEVKRVIAKKKLKLYTVDALKIATALGLGNRINTIMQAAFFKLAGIIPYEQAEEYMKDAAKKSYGKKGDVILKMNYDAIDNAINGLKQIKYDAAAWKNATTGAVLAPLPDDKYFREFIHPVLSLRGDSLPVSALNARGVVPTATTRFEKRGIAAKTPRWLPDKCIQCNQCSFVCPHAVIRPVLMKDGTLAPDTFAAKDMRQMPGYKYRIQVSPYDCTGCGSCANVCPAKEKALELVTLDIGIKEENDNYNFSQTLPEVETPFKPETIIGSQFRRPYFEFSGACAGCGETPYIKLITQLFGDRMIIANATGCTSIYGGSAPTCPYSKDGQGRGPAWANSLFEDNAEFGYGINLAYTQRRAKLAAEIIRAVESGVSPAAKDAFNLWLENRGDAEGSKKGAVAVRAVLDGEIKAAKGEIKELLTRIKLADDCLVKKSVWIFGGDGWAYDIGYGGLDHVLAMNEDVNLLVLDTEVYSNTGGQSSKATPTGSIAKFAASGKRTKKKDLGLMAMSYGYVYVAQVAIGANMNQLLKAVTEAEAHKGPSLIIAYSTCINHGIDMSNGILTTRKAVDSGYWHLYRYNPNLKDLGKNPFTLDSKDPSAKYRDFLAGEIRYNSLSKQAPETADRLFGQAEAESAERLAMYKRLAQ